MDRATRLSGLGFTFALTVVGALGLGCDATRRDEGSCFKEDCRPGFTCTSDHRCVPVPDGGGVEASRPDVSRGPDVSLGLDGASLDLSSPIDAGADVPISVGPIDGAVALDSATEAGPARPVDAAAVDVGGVDAYVPDAPGTCASDLDCTGKLSPYCLLGLCVSCKSGDQCGGGAPICSARHTCVSCAVVDAGCPSATPACEADSGRCLECLGDGDCTKDPSKSFCQAGTCGGCAGSGASACAARNPAKPVCLPGGLCAECATSDDCKSTAKPICDTSASACVACTRDEQCQAKVGGPGVCMFHQDGHCATDAESVYVGKNGAGVCSDSGAGSAQTPYCTAQTAVGVAKSASKPVVVVMGQVGGFSVGALSSPLTVVGRSAVISPADYADGISITRGELYLRGLTVAGNPSGVTGMGINAQAATGATVVLHMDGCTVKGNPGGGILLTGTWFDIHNSKITGNGPAQTAGGTNWGGIRIESLPPAVPAGQASLNLVTIQNNLESGLSCSSAIQGQGVLVSGNTRSDIAAGCGLVSCAMSSPTCGAQP